MIGDYSDIFLKETVGQYCRRGKREQYLFVNSLEWSFVEISVTTPTGL